MFFILFTSSRKMSMSSTKIKIIYKIRQVKLYVEIYFKFIYNYYIYFFNINKINIIFDLYIFFYIININ